jgi:oxygen-independent coproporphyrinogen-3 oxidase
LRRLEGVSRDQFARSTGFEIERLVSQPLARYVNLGMLCDRDGRVRLTREGLFVSDAIWPDLLSSQT